MNELWYAVRCNQCIVYSNFPCDRGSCCCCCCRHRINTAWVAYMEAASYASATFAVSSVRNLEHAFCVWWIFYSRSSELSDPDSLPEDCACASHIDRCSRQQVRRGLTLILLTWRIWWAPNNASRWQMGFNSACKGLRGNTCIYCSIHTAAIYKKSKHIPEEKRALIPTWNK